MTTLHVMRGHEAEHGGAPVRRGPLRQARQGDRRQEIVLLHSCSIMNSYIV